MNLKAQIHRISCFPYRHEGRSQEIFLALRSFLFLSQKVSPFPLSHIGRYTPYRHFERSEKSSLHSVVSCFFHGKFPLFPLSHIRRYTGVPKRSLGFARDDDTGIALSKHIRCTLREINPFPHTVISSVARNLPCTPSFLAPFAERVSPFPLSHIWRYTSVPERSLDFAQDDDTGIALSKHIRCTLREINPFPHTVISSAVEKSSLHSVISCSFHRKGFPFSAISHGTLYQYARKIPPLRSG